MAGAHYCLLEALEHHVLNAALKNLRKQAPEVSTDCSLVSVEVARSTLDAFALGAFGDVLDFAILEEGLHRDFTAARAVETVGRT
jgi:hypothetical protein